MPRPPHCRRVAQLPQATYYEPAGVPLASLQCVTLTVAELEAIRLADVEGLYQEQAAQKMNVSRQTFGRILESAHRKVAEALVNAKALSIEGGNFELLPQAVSGRARRRFRRGRSGPGQLPP